MHLHVIHNQPPPLPVLRAKMMGVMDDPDEKNGWRSLAKFQLGQHERRLAQFEEKLEKFAGEQNKLRLELGDVMGDIKDLRGDILRAAAQVEEGRRNDMEALKGSIVELKQAKANVNWLVLTPIFTAVISALLILALTGGLH